MKQVDPSQVHVVKAGKNIEMAIPIRLQSILAKIDRDDSVLYWMQPPNGGIDDQFACIKINGKFYFLNSKMEKVVFRDVRLTREFCNYETLADGTRKLRIPRRLLREKLRTSQRVSSRYVVLILFLLLTFDTYDSSCKCRKRNRESATSHRASPISTWRNSSRPSKRACRTQLSPCR